MAIHKHSYTTYQGEHRERRLWWPITRQFMGFALGRWRTRILLLLCLLPSLFALIAVVGEFAAKSKFPELLGGPNPGAMANVYYLQFQFFALVMLYAVSGCNALSSDIRNQVLDLYFSRPIDIRDYIFGKWLGLFLLGSIITVIPMAVISLLRVAYYTQTEQLFGMVQQMSAATMLSVGITVLSAVVVSSLSAWTKRSGYAVLIWLALIIIPVIITAIIGIGLEGNQEWLSLMSLQGNLWILSKAFLGKSTEVPVVISFGTCLLIGVAGVALLRHRLSNLEALR